MVIPSIQTVKLGDGFTHIIYNQPRWLGAKQSEELNQSAKVVLNQLLDGDIYHGEYINKSTTRE